MRDFDFVNGEVEIHQFPLTVVDGHPIGCCVDGNIVLRDT